MPTRAIEGASPFAQFVRTLRRERGLTQVELGEAIDVTNHAVSTWEHGVAPNDTNLVKLARFTKVPVVELADMLPDFDAPSPLRLARWQRYLTRPELAQLTNTNQSVIQAWETGQAEPRDRTWKQLTDVLGPLDEIQRRPRHGWLSLMGTKQRLLPVLLPLIPMTDTYVEPYGGTAAVLLARRPVEREIYNDLNGDLVNLFRVVQDPALSEQLESRLARTPASRAEHAKAAKILTQGSPATLTKDDSKSRMLDQAWAFFVIMNQGFQGRESHLSSNWRSFRVEEWWKRVATAGYWHERLAHVFIEETDALELIERVDSPSTTFYIDPPYLARAGRDYTYRVEAGLEHHRRLVELLLGVSGPVVLSGYANSLYERLKGWEVTRLGGGRKPEMVWRNQAAVALD